MSSPCVVSYVPATATGAFDFVTFFNAVSGFHEGMKMVNLNTVKPRGQRGVHVQMPHGQYHKPEGQDDGQLIDGKSLEK